VSAMRLRLGRARLLGGLVGARQPGQGRCQLVTRWKTRRPGEIIAPGSGIDQAYKCTCWPKPDDARPCTPQTCDWRCRACRIHGRPFYSHGDLHYLEHGTGPMAAELQGGPIGTLDVYSARPRSWDDSEVSALQAYAGIVANLLGSVAAAHVEGGPGRATPDRPGAPIPHRAGQGCPDGTRGHRCRRL